MATETTSEAPKPPVKRSLFNKPAWSRPENLASPTDFFHRANSAHVDPVTEVERRRKAKAARKVAEKVRHGAEAQPVKKKRRVSADDDDDLYGASDQEIEAKDSSEVNIRLKPAKSDSEPTKSSLKRETSPKSLAERYDENITQNKPATKPNPQPSNIIDLEGSDEDKDIEVTQVRKPRPPEDDDFPASDEEYAELARKAREKARRKRLEDDIRPAPQIQSHSVETESQSRRSLSTQMLTPPPPPPTLDPEVHILVTSRLENTIPLIVKRRLSQRLKDVRLAWCSRNHFAPEMASSIFLTWKGNRLFDVTTSKSLGIAVDQDGRLLAKGHEDIMADEDRKIHMEAMTEKIYDEYQKAKRRATEPKDEDVEEEQTLAPLPPQEEQIRVILKARGLADLKLIAKPSTPFARMVAAFRKANTAGTQGKEVYIVFDGDRLEPEMKVGETEISDMDELDVYIK